MPESPKIPDKDAPAPNLPMLSPDPVPSPPAKAGEPSPAKPLKDSSLSPRRRDVVLARATAIQSDPPMQANWNAALEPEAVGENRLRSASYQQRAVETVNPLRCALDGYCPVELQDNDRWVAGNPEFQLSYQGQVYHFYNEAARNQFEAAPQKYAPVRGGSDVVLLLEENRNVPGSVNHSAVWHGRLYLFSTAATLATFQQDPSRYADSPRQATLQLPASSL
jgi:YHS domain-containing protein